MIQDFYYLWLTFLLSFFPQLAQFYFSRYKLKKVKAFISACGLSSDYQQFRYNSTIKSKNLE